MDLEPENSEVVFNGLAFVSASSNFEKLVVQINLVGSYSMKRFAILVMAVFAVALMENQSEAQFYGGRGFGGSGFGISIGTGGFNRGFGGFNRGFGGVGFSSGFNRGFGGYGGGFNSFGPSYYRSYRPSYGYGRSFYGGGGYRGGCGW